MRENLQGTNLHKIRMLVKYLLEAAKEGKRGEALVRFAGVMWQSFDPYANPEIGEYIATIIVNFAELVKVLNA